MPSSDINKIVSNIVGLDQIHLSNEILLEDIGWDSLSALEFVAKIDKSFSISIDAEVLTHALTVGDLVSVVTKQLNKNG